MLGTGGSEPCGAPVRTMQPERPSWTGGRRGSAGFGGVRLYRRAVRITHKVDYGVRAMTALAVEAARAPGRPVTRAALATQHNLPSGFLDDILKALRAGGLLRSQRGADGGWVLARPAASITVAEVIRVLEGPLASVRGVRPHELAAAGEREPFVSLWVAVRAALRSVLEHVSIADLAAGQLPEAIAALVADPDAWASHPPQRTA